VPVKLTITTVEVCCRCGQITKSGIFIRRAPETMACCGRHENFWLLAHSG
jgi:hypothetical protein